MNRKKRERLRFFANLLKLFDYSFLVILSQVIQAWVLFHPRLNLRFQFNVS